MESSPYSAPRNSAMAIISLVGGILGWTFLPFLGSLVAIITGHMAKSEINKSNGMLTGGGMATAGLILGYAAVVIGLCALCLGIVLPLVFGVSLLPFLESGYY
ncbi:MAG: DUF4190 domain-containing protein [Chloroflexi bacterium]|nr:DUF4190 domain-containing protein [Chloroflexota bacterium]